MDEENIIKVSIIGVYENGEFYYVMSNAQVVLEPSGITDDMIADIQRQLDEL